MYDIILYMCFFIFYQNDGTKLQQNPEKIIYLHLHITKNHYLIENMDIMYNKSFLNENVFTTFLFSNVEV